MYSKYKTHNQAFVNYAYHRLKCSTKEERERLSIDEQTMFKNDTTLDRFCRTQPKEHLDYLLTKIGVQWVQIYGNSHDDILDLATNSFEQSSFPQKRADLISQMAERQIFVTNSSAQMVSLQIAAQNSHSKVYSISLQAREMILSRKLFKHAEMEVEGIEAEAAYEDFTRMLCNMLNSFFWIEENMNISHEEMMILSILFNHRTRAMSKVQIQGYFHLSKSATYVGKHLEKLIAKNYVTSDIETNRNKHFQKKACYIISSLGIASMIKYHNYIHEISFGKKKRRKGVI